MDTPYLNILSLCSGAGQLDVGIASALARRGIRARHVAYAERQAEACAALKSRMEEQALEPAPIWGGNLQDLPAASFHGMVDAVSAGFPCQPFSGAGLQLGPEDERHLLPYILDVADTVGASALFLENVSGLKKWFDHITTLLLQRGWNCQWGTLRAADVGAGHRRERWFGVAYREHVPRWAKRGIGPWGRLHAPATDGSVFGAEGIEFLADGECSDIERPEGAGIVAGACAAHQGGERSEQRDASDGGVCGLLAHGLSAGSQGHERDGDRGGESRRVAPEPTGSVAQGGGELGRMADGARGGCRKLRESSGGNRQSDGSREELGNTPCDDERRSADGTHRPGEPDRGSGLLLADCDGTGCGVPDVPKTEGWQPDSSALWGSRGMGQPESGLAHGTGQFESGRFAYHSDAGLPVFAPGPSDPRWSGILSRFPLLAPALPVSPVAMRATWSRILGGSGVEAQSSVHLLADGMAPALDISDTYLATRADQLRIAGNGVCWQQADWAYHQHLNRIVP